MRDHDQIKIGRRTLFARGAALAGSAAAASLIETNLVSKAEAAGGPSGPLIVAGDANAVVETTAGKVRGFTRNGIQTFKGIPFAATTEGSGRFLAPTKPKPWTGVRSCMYYGPTCPQAPRNGWSRDENAFLFQWDDGQPGEDCLRINLWSPGLATARKDP